MAAFAAGDIVAPGEGGEIVAPIDLRLALAGQELKFPLRATFVFDNEGPRFPALFQGAEVIEDPEPLLDYAMHLHALAKRSSATALAAELRPKMRDYAAAYYEDETTLNGQLLDFLRDRMFPGPLDLAFGRTDILPVPWCGGRIWELRRLPHRAFFSTQGGDLEIPVYVARHEGALKVVR